MYDLILKNIGRHITLTKREKDYFISKLVYETYQKKDIVLQPNKVALHAYFVNSGCLKLYEYNDKAEENIITFVPKNWWNSDLYSFLTQEPATQYLQAIEETKLLKLSKQNLEDIYIEIPKFERYFRILHQNSQIAFIYRIRNNNSLTAEERYDEFVEKHPNLDLTIPQKDIASYIGITPEFLSKIRKRKKNSRGK
jgi:CRP-like cAMP-binding protein